MFGINKIYPNFKFEVESFMADGSYAIRDAVDDVFDVKSDMCNFHFWKSARPKIYQEKKVPKLDKNAPILKIHKEIIDSCSTTKDGSKIILSPIIKFDVRVLETLPTLNHFTCYLKIIRPFWKRYCINFYNYFMETWVDENQSSCITGWQFYLKKAYVSTNNSLESFNRVIKAVRTQYSQLPFDKYTEIIIEEIKSRSLVSGKKISFPTRPTIYPGLINFACCLVERFENYFVKHNQHYYVKDKFLISSLYNKKTKRFKVVVKALCKKLEKKNEEAIRKFYEYYSKPTERDVNAYEKHEFKIRSHFINNAKIRKIFVNNDPGLQIDERIQTSSCTCPDYFSIRICQHLLAVLIKLEYFHPDIEFKAQKGPGRPKKVSAALVKEEGTD